MTNDVLKGIRFVKNENPTLAKFQVGERIVLIDGTAGTIVSKGKERLTVEMEDNRMLTVTPDQARK